MNLTFIVAGCKADHRFPHDAIPTNASKTARRNEARRTLQ